MAARADVRFGGAKGASLDRNQRGHGVHMPPGAQPAVPGPNPHTIHISTVLITQ
jgi:hypothetical protein